MFHLQLHKVIAEVKKITDKPILAITRKKCSRGLTGFHPKLKVQEIVKELKDVHNTHLFFVDYRYDFYYLDVLAISYHKGEGVGATSVSLIIS